MNLQKVTSLFAVAFLSTQLQAATPACLPMDLLFKQVEQKQFTKVNLDSLRTAAKADIAKSFEVTVKPIKRSIKWNGPRTPESLQDLQFKERLQLKNLKYSVEQYGRNPLDEVIAVAIQMGTEQGIRLRKSHPLWQQLMASTNAIEQAIAEQNTEQYTAERRRFDSTWAQVKVAKYFPAEASTYVPFELTTRGEFSWPKSSAPIQTKQMIAALAPAFDQAASITPKVANAKFEDVISQLIETGVRLETRSMVESRFGKANRIDMVHVLLPQEAQINWQTAETVFGMIAREVRD
jgi:hypothetical protein